MVFLIDEWDKPLSDHLDNEVLFNAIRSVLSVFSNWLRTLHNVRFLLLTGIMRYKDTNTFTGQDIVDLSMSPTFAPLLGYSLDDIKQSFAPYITHIAAQLSLSEDELLAELTNFYDGFCFDYDAKVRMYNPWSINNFFNQWDLSEEPRFANFWINSTSNLVTLNSFMKRSHITYSDIAAIYGNNAQLQYGDLAETKRFSKVEFLPLLALNGYLSIKKICPPIAFQPEQRTFMCGFPNYEVAQSFGFEFFKYAIDAQIVRADLPPDLSSAIAAGNVAMICQYLNEMLSNLLYDALSTANEVQYRALIANAIQYCNYTVREETYNRSGRSDIEIELTDPDTAQVKQVYVLELKLMDKDHDSPETCRKLIEEAYQQILKRGYGVNRFTQGKHVTGIVLVLSARYRQIVAWRQIDNRLASPNHTLDGTVEPMTLLNKPEDTTQSVSGEATAK